MYSLFAFKNEGSGFLRIILVSQTEYERLQNQLQKLTAERDSLLSELNQSNGTTGSLRRSEEKLENDILKKQVLALDSDNQKLATELKQLSTDLSSMRSKSVEDIDSKKEEIERLKTWIELLIEQLRTNHLASVPEPGMDGK